MRHPHRHRSFAPALRGQRPAWAVMLAWLALLSLLMASLPVLNRHLPGHAALVLQQPAEERRGGETAEESPAKLRRVTTTRAADAPQRMPEPAPLDALDALMASLTVRPPHVTPSIGSAPPAPLPAAPGLRLQRGQAPPQG